jgi:tRNA wybutosine-synthesizing protein 3
MTVFDQRKTQIQQELTSDKPDLSPKGSPDDGVLSLLELLNVHHDYMTTSSCSGRAVVFLDTDKEDGKGDDARGRWLMNRHTPFTEDDLSISSLEQFHFLLFGDINVDNGSSPDPSDLPSRMVAFKFEPLVLDLSSALITQILHVLCRDIGAASRLLNAATRTGYRESGMSISGHGTPQEKVIVAIRTNSLHLDIPLASYDSKWSTVIPLGLSAIYLRSLLKLANRRFKENERRKESLVVALQSLLDHPGLVGQVKETKEVRRMRKREEGLRLQASSRGITGNYSTGEGIQYGDTLFNDDDEDSSD